MPPSCSLQCIVLVFPHRGMCVLCGADHGADLDQRWKRRRPWISCMPYNHAPLAHLACFLLGDRAGKQKPTSCPSNGVQFTAFCLNIRALAVVLIRSAGDVEDKDPAAVSWPHDLASPRLPATPSPVAPAHRCWHTLLLRAASGAWAQGLEWHMLR